MKKDQIYGVEERTRAGAMSEAELRHRVDRLLEQAAREAAHPPLTPQGGMLHASEIFWLLGVGPWPGAAAMEELKEMIERGDH